MKTIAPAAQYYAKVANRLRRVYRDVNARFSFEHLSGPRSLHLAPDDVAVVCLIKNASPYIDNFLRHYRKLGAAHFIFVDNGSTDDTIEKASAAREATIVRSTLPFNPYQMRLRWMTAKKFAMGSWCICADMDELFDFHHADEIGLKGLTRYLAERSFTCAIGQMLDMLPESEASLTSQLAADYESSCPYYDLSGLEKHDYKTLRYEGLDYFTRDNTVASSEIQWMFGGVRRRLFGANVLLTKHPITRISPEANPCSHPHCASNVRCADITVLVRHYKFVADFRRRIEVEAKSKAFVSGDRERYLAGLQRAPELQFIGPTARRYAGTQELVKEKFLVTSPAFEQWVATYKARQGLPSASRNPQIA